MKVEIIYHEKGRDTVRIHLDPRDFWSGDVTLARVIQAFLKKYRARYNRKNGPKGYPSDLERGEKDEGFGDWMIILDKMIYAFGWIAKAEGTDGPEWDNFSKEVDILLKPHNKELKRLKKEDTKRFAALDGGGALNSLYWDRRIELMEPLHLKYGPIFKAHHARVQEGIDLFAKYYLSLWE